MKDVEIGTIGEAKIYMRLDELFKIANKEVQEYAESLELENKKLQYNLKTAIKVLRFYTNRRNFDFNNEKELRYCNSDDQADVYQFFGQKARDCLKEIEE